MGDQFDLNKNIILHKVKMGNIKLFHCLVIITITNSAFARDLFYKPNKKNPLVDIFEYGQNSYPLDGQPNNVDLAYQEPPLNQNMAISSSKAAKFSNRMERYLEENNVVCEVQVTKEVFSEDGFDFLPSEYFNKSCVVSNGDPYKAESHVLNNKPEMCLHDDNDFGCKTLYEEMTVLKRNKNKRSCWDYTTQLVAVGCKCNIRFKYNQYN